MDKPLISIITPCYNEQDNVDELYARITTVIQSEDKYRYELMFIDNNSTDATVEKLKTIARLDHRVTIIVNARNFGHIRSPYYGILQTMGVATIYLASDLQDPPEYIPQFLRAWEEGYKLVMTVKPVSDGNRVMHGLRKSYYRLLDGITEIPIVKDSTGFGLYDKEVLDQLRKINDPYPFLRGLICELGYKIKVIPFNQPRRMRGVTKNNFYTLYDIAWLGLVSHSKLPLRLASFAGLLLGAGSVLAALVYFVLKLLYWNRFPLGFAPLMIGMFFLHGLLLIFIGILGEYVGSIHTYVQNRPIVVEKERLNFSNVTDEK